jgi:hypothetical protein
VPVPSAGEPALPDEVRISGDASWEFDLHEFFPVYER